ncbi:IS110 family transposase [Microbacterium sp.]|uniref:IS110 family transposase n=1 Tax=Microbacterium sp. TaxID=51671 RepID=UPI002736D9E1|nr:IS110 family transposase [Microbacterium sp.]MDP3951457.1 IS110 family transposase [Microbacterium sp.]
MNNANAVAGSSGVSRGDRNRNARLDQLRVAVPLSNAIVGIDLADEKQMVVVCDHDSRVLARRTFRCKAWDLGRALDWAAGHATRAGFAGATVACEPTGHRWRILGQLAGKRGMSFVCVQPTLTSRARKDEDLTHDKTDEKDAVLIARLTAQLRCYLPEPVDETWGRLRHLGRRREQVIADKVAAVQQIRDLLECTWPAALDTAAQPFKSHTWLAALAVVMCRDGGDLARTRRLGAKRFETAVRREIIKRGWAKPRLRIVRNMYAALDDPAGVVVHRVGAFERIGWLIEDWDTAVAKLEVVEARMVATLEELRLADLVCSIDGLSAVGAAAILAETGDLARFASARAVVKHAGLAPRERLSGTFTGRARLGGAGRPGLRVAAWRAVWGALHNNPVYAERYRHLTTRDDNRLTPTQAQTVVAAAILRQLHAVVTTRTAWDPAIARHGLGRTSAITAAA